MSKWFCRVTCIFFIKYSRYSRYIYKTVVYSVVYGSRLSHILDKPSISVFPIWYTNYITWYTRYIISNVTFTIWKTWYNDCKCVVPGISHEKLGLTKNLPACSPFSYYITGIRRYSSVTFTQSKVLLFWICLDFQGAQCLLSLSKSCISFIRVNTV